MQEFFVNDYVEQNGVVLKVTAVGPGYLVVTNGQKVFSVNRSIYKPVLFHRPRINKVKAWLSNLARKWYR